MDTPLEFLKVCAQLSHHKIGNYPSSFHSLSPSWIQKGMECLCSSSISPASTHSMFLCLWVLSELEHFWWTFIWLSLQAILLSESNLLTYLPSHP